MMCVYIANGGMMYSTAVGVWAGIHHLKQTLHNPTKFVYIELTIYTSLLLLISSIRVKTDRAKRQKQASVKAPL